MKPIRMKWKIWPWRDRRLAKFLKRIQFFLFPFFKYMKLASLLEIPFDFYSSTPHPVNIVVQRLSLMSMNELIRLRWRDNPEIQLIIICIFIRCNRASRRTWSLVSFKVLPSSIKGSGWLPWAEWLWRAPNIYSWAIAADKSRNFYRMTPQAPLEYFWRRCHRHLAFFWRGTRRI